MKNYQKLGYRHYYRMLANGESVECTCSECFAKGDAPSADNPYPQRWYYSPDREVAIRLSRNAAGEEYHKANAADLKAQERAADKPTRCIGQTALAACSVTCQNCPACHTCELPERATNGVDCKYKCSCCSVYQRSTLDLDKPLGENDDGSEILFEVEDGHFNVEAEYTAAEQHTAILGAVDALTQDERYLWDSLLNGKTKAAIAAECGLSEGAIRKRVKKLAATLRENPGIKNFF